MTGAGHQHRVNRARRHRLRKRRNSVLFAGSFGMVVAVTAALSLAGLSGVDLADAAVSKAKSFADLMKQRSPGKRTAAQLIKT